MKATPVYSRFREHGALIFILVVGAAVRFGGLRFGLPALTEARPDELLVILPALRFGTGDFNPHFFKYPSLYLYVLFFFYAAYYVLGRLSGRFACPADFILEFALDPSNLFLINRGLSALLGTLTIVATYKVSSRIMSKKYALLSSLFLSLAYLHARNSHFGVTDAPATLLTMLSCYYLLKIYQEGLIKDYALAGVLSGLATSTKYFGIFLAFPILLASGFNRFSSGPGGKLIGAKKPLLLWAWFCFAFLAGTPFALLDFKLFISELLYQYRVISGEQNLAWIQRGLFFHLYFTLYHGVGPTMLLAALLGAAVFFKKRTREAAVLFAFPLVYYLFAGKGFSVFTRYMFPVIPFVAIGAGLGQEKVEQLISARFPAWGKKWLTVLLAALILFPSTRNLVKFDLLISRTDNRLLARQWIMANIPEGASIYERAAGYAGLMLLQAPMILEKKVDEKEDQARSLYYQAKIEYFRAKKIAGYELWTYHPRTGEFQYLSQPQKSTPQYIITEETPLITYQKLPGPGLSQLLQNSYVLIKSFEAVDIHEPGNRYDQKDAFYLPYAGFKAVERPGPNIYIYRRKL